MDSVATKASPPAADPAPAAGNPHGEIAGAPSPRMRLRAFFWGRSLEECIEGGRDNILLVRLIAALLVIYGHCAVGGANTVPYDFVHWVVPDIWTQLLGLYAFFLLSGILVTLSYLRTPHLARFLRARLLRIWPALAVCVLAWAFVFGPMLTELPLATYFSTERPDSPYRYAYQGLSIFQTPHFLPGVFAHNFAANHVNSPLWTIAAESTLYLWVAGAGVLRLLRLPWLTSFAIAAIFSYLILWPMSRGQVDLTHQLQPIVQGFFGAGVIMCLLRKYIRVSSGIMLVIAIAFGLSRLTMHHLPFALLATAYGVLWIAYVPRLPEMPLRADFSYGAYLWGWPVQQTIVQVLHVKSPLVIFAIAAPIALVIGALSWFWIEKPALRLKDRRISWPAWIRRAPKPIAPLPAGATGVVSAEQAN